MPFHHISRPFFFFCLFCFFLENFAFLIFYEYFSCSLTWDHREKKPQTTSLLKLRNTDSLQKKKKNMHTCREGLYQSCKKICEISNFGFLPIFFFFFVFVDIGPYGRKKFQMTSCLTEHNRFALKNSCMLLGMVSTKVV